jgi:RimJ/RimL family protein N-acetyltransferase
MHAWYPGDRLPVQEAFMSHIVLETERLVVRRYELDDADQAYAIYSEPDVWRWLGGGSPHVSVEESRAWVERLLKRADEWDPIGAWAVVRREDNQLLGTVHLLPLEGGPDIEIGYHYGKDFWGHGYASEVARAVIPYGFEVTEEDELVGVVFQQNIASQRVLENAGLKYVGQRHCFGQDMMHYRISRSDLSPGS